MEIPLPQLPPGDIHLVEAIVGQIKSKGIFDKFRRDCLSDVDTKPAFQNLRLRVEGQVKRFLGDKQWTCDTNKNQIRDGVRKDILDSGILDTGIDAIINQVVNPKINSLILPLVEDNVYAFLSIEKPKREIKDELLQQSEFFQTNEDIHVTQMQIGSFNHPYGVTEKMPPYFPKNDGYPIGVREDLPVRIEHNTGIKAEEFKRDIEDHSFQHEPPSSKIIERVPPSRALPMDTISSSDDEILKQVSVESHSSNSPKPTLNEGLKMEEDNAVDSFDQALRDSEAVAAGVDKMSLKESVETMEVDHKSSDRVLPLFDKQSLDSISSNSTGLSFSPGYNKKPEKGPDYADDVRSTQSTPLEDEKKPTTSMSSLESSNSADYKFMPKDLKSDKTLQSFNETSDTKLGKEEESAGITSVNIGPVVVEGASPVSADDSQGSFQGTQALKETKKKERSEGELSSSSSSISANSNDSSSFKEYPKDKYGTDRDKSKDGGKEKHHATDRSDKNSKHSKTSQKDDHYSHHDKHNKHRRDRDDDKDRHSSKSHSSSHQNSKTSSSSSKNTSGGSKRDKKSGERSEHKSHSSGHSRSDRKSTDKHESSKSKARKSLLDASTDIFSLALENKIKIGGNISHNKMIQNSRRSSLTEKQPDKVGVKNEPAIQEEKIDSKSSKNKDSKKEIPPKTEKRMDGKSSSTKELKKEAVSQAEKKIDGKNNPKKDLKKDSSQDVKKITNKGDSNAKLTSKKVEDKSKLENVIKKSKIERRDSTSNDGFKSNKLDSSDKIVKRIDDDGSMSASSKKGKSNSSIFQKATDDNKNVIKKTDLNKKSSIKPEEKLNEKLTSKKNTDLQKADIECKKSEPKDNSNKTTNVKTDAKQKSIKPEQRLNEKLISRKNPELPKMDVIKNIECKKIEPKDVNVKTDDGKNVNKKINESEKLSLKPQQKEVESKTNKKNDSKNKPEKCLSISAESDDSSDEEHHKKSRPLKMSSSSSSDEEFDVEKSLPATKKNFKGTKLNNEQNKKTINKSRSISSDSSSSSSSSNSSSSDSYSGTSGSESEDNEPKRRKLLTKDSSKKGNVSNEKTKGLVNKRKSKTRKMSSSESESSSDRESSLCNLLKDVSESSADEDFDPTSKKGSSKKSVDTSSKSELKERNDKLNQISEVLPRTANMTKTKRPVFSESDSSDDNKSSLSKLIENIEYSSDEDFKPKEKGSSISKSVGKSKLSEESMPIDKKNDLKSKASANKCISKSRLDESESETDSSDNEESSSDVEIKSTNRSVDTKNKSKINNKSDLNSSINDSKPKKVEVKKKNINEKYSDDLKSTKASASKEIPKSRIDENESEAESSDNEDSSSDEEIKSNNKSLNAKNKSKINKSDLKSSIKDSLPKMVEVKNKNINQKNSDDIKSTKASASKSISKSRINESKSESETEPSDNEESFSDKEFKPSTKSISPKNKPKVNKSDLRSNKKDSTPKKVEVKKANVNKKQLDRKEKLRLKLLLSSSSSSDLSDSEDDVPLNKIASPTKRKQNLVKIKASAKSPIKPTKSIQNSDKSLKLKNNKIKQSFNDLFGNSDDDISEFEGFDDGKKSTQTKGMKNMNLTKVKVGRKTCFVEEVTASSDEFSAFSFTSSDDCSDIDFEGFEANGFEGWDAIDAGNQKIKSFLAKYSEDACMDIDDLWGECPIEERSPITTFAGKDISNTPYQKPSLTTFDPMAHSPCSSLSSESTMIVKANCEPNSISINLLQSVSKRSACESSSGDECGLKPEVKKMRCEDTSSAIGSTHFSPKKEAIIKDYDLDLAASDTMYSPLSPASTSSTDHFKEKLKDPIPEVVV